MKTRIFLIYLLLSLLLITNTQAESWKTVYSCSFASQDEFQTWSTRNNSGGTNWAYDASENGVYTDNSDGWQAQNNWLISPSIRLYSSRSYRVTFETMTAKLGAQTFTVYSGVNGASSDTKLAAYSFQSAEWTASPKRSGSVPNPTIDGFTVAADGDYKISFQCTSPSERGSLFLRNFVLQEEIQSRIITINTAINGVIEVKNGNRIIVDNDQVDNETVLTVNAIPDSGYRLLHVMVDDVAITTSSIIVNKDITISAIFEPIPVASMGKLPPYNCAFDTQSEFDTWIVKDVAGDGTWSWDSQGSATVVTGKNNNDYLISPAISLIAGEEYCISFDNIRNGNYRSMIKLLFSKDLTTLSDVLIDERASDYTFANRSINFIPMTTGDYYFAFHSIDDNSFKIKNFSIKAPKSDSDLTCNKVVPELINSNVKMFYGNQYGFNIEIENVGKLPQGNYIVELLDGVNGNVLATSAIIEEPLAVGEKRNTLLNYTPTVGGNLALKGRVTSISDILPDNNISDIAIFHIKKEKDIPYTYDFNNITEWEQEWDQQSGWSHSNGCAKTNNGWMFSPFFYMIKGVQYEVYFDVYVDDSYNCNKNNTGLGVSIGTASNNNAHVIAKTLYYSDDFKTTPEKKHVVLTASATGFCNIGFYGFAGPYRYVLVDNVSIKFKVMPCVVNINQPTDGNIVVKNGGNDLISGDAVNTGTMLTIDAVPNNVDVYELDKIVVGSFEYSSTPITVGVIENPTDIRAVFKLIPTAVSTINISQPSFGGSIIVKNKKTGEVIEDGIEVLETTTLTVESKAASGYKFENIIIDDVVNTTNPADIVVGKNAVNISGNFKAIEYSVTVFDLPNGTLELKKNGELVSPETTFKYGDKITITAIPKNDHYNFHSINVNGSLYVENPKQIDVNSNLSISAIFNPKEYTLNIVQPTLGGTIEVKYGNILLTGSVKIAYNVTLAVSAKSFFGYDLNSILAGGVEFFENPLTVQMGEDMYTISAQFKVKTAKEVPYQTLNSQAEFNTWLIRDDEGTGNKWEWKSQGVGGVITGATIYTSAGCDDWLISQKVSLSNNSQYKITYSVLTSLYNTEDYNFYIGNSFDINHNSRIIHSITSKNTKLDWELITVNNFTVDATGEYAFGINCTSVGEMLVLKDFKIEEVNVTFPITFVQPLSGGSFIVKKNGVPINSGDEVPYNTELTVEVIPEIGYELASLKANEHDIRQTQTFSVKEATEIVAQFKPKQFEITIVSSSKGLLSVTKDGVDVNSGDMVEYNTLLEITATPNSGYEVVAVKIDGNVYVGNTIQVTKQLTISAEYKFIPTLQGIPYYCTFATQTLFETWSTRNDDGQSVVWEYSSDVKGSGSAGALLDSNGNSSNDDWLVSQPITMETAIKYVIKFKAYTNTDENFRLVTGMQSAINTTNSTEIKNYIDGLNTNRMWVEQVIDNITVDADNDYYFAFQYYSSSKQYLGIKDFSVEEMAKPKYTVTIDTPTGGSLSVKYLDDTPIASGDEVEEDAELVVYATADNDYVLTGIQVNGVKLEGTNRVKVTQNITISASFNPREYYAVTINTPLYGNILVKNGNDIITSGMRVEKETILTIEATPISGYEIDKISVDGVALDLGVNTYTVTKPITIEATFKVIIPEVITVPYLNTFATQGLFDTWSQRSEDLSSEVKWEYKSNVGGNGCAYLNINGTFENKDWLFSPQIKLEAGKMYRIKFKAHTANINERLKVMIGNDNSMTMNNATELKDLSFKTSGTWSEDYIIEEIVIAETKTYCFALYAYSTSSNHIGIKDFAIETMQPYYYTVTIPNLANGTIEVKDGETVITSGTSVIKGTNLVVTATPKLGYDFVKIVSADEEYTENPAIVKITKDASITAEFTISKYTMNYEQPENGTITVTKLVGGDVVNSGTRVDYNMSLKVEAVANDGYNFTNMTINDIDYNDNIKYVNITSNTTISAAFAPKTHTITVVQTANGTISPSTVDIAHGMSQSFSIIADVNYHISDVIVDGNSVGAVAIYEFENVTTVHTITAIFTETEKPIYSITATAEDNGTITPVGVINVEEDGTQTFTMKANQGYEVKDVLVDDVSVGKVLSYTFENVKSDHTISVTFKKILAIDNVEGTGVRAYAFGMNIHVQLVEAINTDIHIIDMNGRVVRHISTDNDHIMITMANSGTYIVRVTTQNGVISNSKVIVM